ncbi:hypothetical protein Gogos_005428 [Gossypium gossypioides]|uniref:Uncharacterized protein n=1 Tax=Gossypium gossypioides TaxID=34282 RepID=A0A7J9D3R1_GOSGO|nr:hypothetical protein [Gossypium gossypioides]
MRRTLAEGIKGNTVVLQQTPCVTSSIEKRGAPITSYFNFHRILGTNTQLTGRVYVTPLTRDRCWSRA